MDLKQNSPYKKQLYLCIALVFLLSVSGLLIACGSSGGAGRGNAFGHDGVAVLNEVPVHEIMAVSVQSNGRILASGCQENSSGICDMIVVGLKPNGTIDKQWGDRGVFTYATSGNSSVWASTVDSLNRNYISGYSNGDYSTTLRLTEDGALDTSFATNGVYLHKILAGRFGIGSALGFSSSGILVAGYTYTGSYQAGLMKLDTNGSVDTSFATSGFYTGNIGAGSETFAMHVLANNKIIMAGWYLDSPNPGGIQVTQLTSSGTPDVTFGTNGIFTYSHGVNNNRVNGIAVQADGKILLSGYVYENIPGRGTVSKLAIWRLTASGQLDTSFGTNGLFTYLNPSQGGDNGYAITQLSSGKIAVAGITQSDTVGSRAAIWLLTNTGALDSTFGTGGTASFDLGASSEARAMTALPNGKIIVAGMVDNKVAVWQFAEAEE